MPTRLRWSLLLILLPACDSATGTGDHIDLDVVGQVNEVVPVAGALVELGYGFVSDVSGGVAETLASTVTGADGRFAFSTRVRCEDATFAVQATHEDYFVHHPGTANVANVACSAATQEVRVYLAPRSSGFRFLPEDPAVQAGDSLELAAIILYVDGSEGDWVTHMFWEVDGEASACGHLSDGYTQSPRYVAPSVVPAEGSCGGDAGQVKVGLRIYEDIEGSVPGASGHTFVTILP